MLHNEPAAHVVAGAHSRQVSGSDCPQLRCVVDDVHIVSPALQSSEHGPANVAVTAETPGW